MDVDSVFDEVAAADGTKNVEVVTKSSGVHSENILSSLMKLRTDDIFCDVTIVCGDFNINAHKNILASATDYFKGMFLNETKEAKTGVVDFSKMSPKVVEQCISFIYSGNVDISMTIARNLLDASEMMQLPELSRLCVEFLAERMDMKSCAVVLKLSNLYIKESLNEPIEAFFRTNFEEFSQSDDFSSLEFQDLLYSLNLYQTFDEGCEKFKWEGILNWINAAREVRSCHFPDLFKTMNLQCLSKLFLREICKERLVNDSMECLRALQDIFTGNYVSSTPRKESTKQSHVISIVEDGVVLVGTVHEIFASKFTRNITLDMDVIYYEGAIYIGTGFKMFRYGSGTWISRIVDFTKVKKNAICVTCPKCFRDHFYLGDSGKFAKTNNKMWSSRNIEGISMNLPSPPSCQSCSTPMGKLKSNESCYNRCIGLGNSVYMLTRNYIVEFSISSSNVVHHNISIGLGTGFSVAGTNQAAYALGGNGTELKAVAFDLVTNEITLLPVMAHPKSFGRACFINKKLYASDKGSSTPMEYYDFVERKWCQSQMKMIPAPQSIHFGSKIDVTMRDVYGNIE